MKPIVTVAARWLRWRNNRCLSPPGLRGPCPHVILRTPCCRSRCDPVTAVVPTGGRAPATIACAALAPHEI
jgi:hypothetical protein